MSSILIFGLILMVITPTSEGVNWVGTFTNPKTCDTTNCCCPADNFVLQDVNGRITSSITTNGSVCASQQQSSINIIMDQNLISNNVTDVGTFAINNAGDLEVLLEQTNQSTNAACKVTMKHVKSLPGGGSTDNNNKTQTVNTNTNSSTNANPNEASLNHISILIQFISLIMTTVFIIHI